MGKIICISARKGGVGKTMTTASLGVGLARRGKKVLLIDTDNQYSLTVSLGVKEPDKLSVSLTTAISDIIAERDFEPTAGIIRHAEGVDLLPANNSLTGIELALASHIGRETVLRQYIDKVKHLYDFILIDTCPTLDLLTVNALTAANSALIPVAPKFLDAKGLELLLKSIAQIRKHINPKLDICGILLTLVDKRANLTKEIIAMIEQAYGENIRIFKEHIPHSVRAAEASATGKSIFAHDPNGKVAAAYDALAGDILADEVESLENASVNEVKLLEGASADKAELLGNAPLDKSELPGNTLVTKSELPEDNPINKAESSENAANSSENTPDLSAKGGDVRG